MKKVTEILRKCRTGLLILMLLYTASTVFAGSGVVTTYSPSMKKEIKAVVVTPASYTKTEDFPVLYLLHGYSGNHEDWITKVPEIQEYADRYRFLIVCPDGNFSSWYFDSPVDSAWKYETYVARELTQWIDTHYSTIASREGRAITGLSMGGHGAFYLAFRNQDVFGAAGSMSGGVDIRPFLLNWDLAARLGTYSEHPENWEENTVCNLVYRLTPGSLWIIFDCGTNDFFYKVNCELHELLLERNIPHDFISRPGGHTWEYWKNSIAFQALFFHNFFTNTKENKTNK